MENRRGGVERNYGGSEGVEVRRWAVGFGFEAG